MARGADLREIGRMKTILIVEDSVLVQKLYAACLAPLNVKLVAARDGRSALDLAAEAKADLVLLDIMLPDTSGIEVMKTLRGSEDYAARPIVAVSTGSKTTSADTLLAAGFDGYIQKPINVADFVNQVKSYLGMGN